MIITKGKFSQPRTPQQEDREIEQAFRQVTEAANNTGNLPRHESDQEPDDFSQNQDEFSQDSGEYSQNPEDYSQDSEELFQSTDEFSDLPESEIPYPGNTQAARASAENSRKPTSPTIQRNRKIAIASISAACVVLVICLSVGLWFLFRKPADAGVISDNVFIAGINLGGKTPEEAAAALHAATDTSYTVSDMVVTTNKGNLVLPPAKTGAKLDVDKIVEAAMQYGRSGAKVPAGGQTVEMLPYLNLNTNYIRSAVHDFIARNSGTLVQPSVKENGERPELLPIPEDPDDTPQTLTVTAGKPGISIDENAMYNAILDAYNANDFMGIKMEFAMMQPKPIDAKEIFQNYCLAPVDAKLDTKTYEVTSEVWGYGVTMEELTGLLKDLDAKGSVQIPMKYIKPKVTSEELSKTLFRDTLATYDTDYNMYNTSRSKNLELAAAAINGTVLLPGETFSFNDVVGERTREKGYESAGAYTSEGAVDQVGGGVCQVASTIYYCTLMADLETIDREEHMYVVSYVPMGMDATINWGTIDFAFRNNTKYPIRMETWAKDGEVHVALIGTDDKDYYVKMEYEIEETYDWKTVEKKFPADNKKGYTDGQSISDPHTGYDVKTYKVKYDKNTDEQISRKYEATSNYEKQDEIIVVIDKPEETTTPSEPTTQPTQPETTEPSVPETTEETTPETSEPAPTETEPVETEPTETEPVETEPTETEPSETPAESESTDPAPEISEPEDVVG